MGQKLTPRMKNWISKLGVHIALVDKNGKPVVIVTESCHVSDAFDSSIIVLKPNQNQYKLISEQVEMNTWAAAAPGQLGSVRAPYQFKGLVKTDQETVSIFVKEIYCTKPGDEAGYRLDVMTYDDILQFDESRWPDLSPPGYE